MATIDISGQNDTDFVNGAIITNTTLAIATGTGVYDPFLSIQNSPEEEGFNTDSHDLPLDGNHDEFTHSVLLSTVPVRTVDGVEYLEFRADLNESNGQNADLILLEQLKIFQESSPNMVEANWNGSGFYAGDVPEYTIGDNQVLLSAKWDAGSGKGDYVFLIPKSNFDFSDTANPYLYVYMKMGLADNHDPAQSDGGFEEFGVLSVPVVETPPSIDIVKTGPATVAEGGEDVIFHFVITNTSGATDPVTVTSLVDDVYGDLTAAAIAANGGNPIVLAPGATFSFDYNPPGDLVLNAGASETNVVTVQGHDDENTPVSDTDDHTIVGTDVPPVIEIVKTGPGTIDEGGAIATWHFEITNNSGETDPVTVTSLVDDMQGDLLAAAIAANGGNPIVLASGQSFGFDFSAELDLNAGDPYTNVVTVTGHDDEGNDTSDDDDDTITVTNVLPSITIDKTGPATVDEGGADVTWTFVITNTSGETDPVTITSLVDDKLGNLLAAAEAANGGQIVLAPNESFTFDYNPAGLVDVSINAGETYHNVVEVTGVDDEGSHASASDDHTITATDVAPAIHLEKTAAPTSIDEGTATDVTYTYEVTNTSPAGAFDPLLLTSFVDDNGTPGVGGDDVNLLTGFAVGASYGAYYASGDTDGDYLVDSNETWTFNYTHEDVTANAGSIINTAVVVGQDDESNSVQDDDDATVTVANVAPAIDIQKTVDADGDGQFHDLEMVQAFGDSVTYKYELTNTSPAGVYDPLTLNDLVDDQLGNLVVDGVLQAGVTLSGDDGDNLLETGETWSLLYTTNVNLAPGQTVHNVATVTAFDDEGSSATDSDDANIQAVAGPGVRTPGFWSNLGTQFWDGIQGNETKSGPNFPGHELTYHVDSDHNGALDAVKGLLIGDYNKDGITGPNEDTFFISLADAHKVIDASQKDLQDGRFVLGRDAVATWLNYLAGNPIGDATDPNSPQHYLDEGIDWLQATNGGTAADTFGDWGGGAAVKQSGTTAWTNPMPGVPDSGNTIHTELDTYNNTGSTFEIVGGVKVFHMYASDGG
jgi:hypothetical protein